MDQKQRKTNSQGVINRDVNASQRALLAVQLRAKRLTYEQIARQCGYANAGSCRAAVLREMNRVVVRDVEQLRCEQLSELDQLQVEVWDLVMDRKNKGRLFAVDRLLAIMERRAKLMGLDIAKDSNVVAAQVVIREVPAGWIRLPVSSEEVQV